jgi:Zn-dependent protease
MNFINLLLQNPLHFIVVAGILLYSIIAHELAHGWVALWCGDDTARSSGRLTLNPVNHLDPIGTLMLFVVGFGWAKPVPVNYANLRNSRFGLIAVALAGCVTNILIAMFALLVIRIPAVNADPGFSSALSFVARINIILGGFNLIPVPPLDGSKVLMGVLPRDMQITLSRFEPFGFFVLIALLVTGLLNPVIIFMQNTIYGLINFIFGMFG